MTFKLKIKSIKKPIEIECSKEKFKEILSNLEKDIITCGPITFAKSEFVYVFIIAQD